MTEIAVRKIRALEPAARAWIASLFGHEFPEDQEVTVSLGPRIRVPSQEERRAASQSLDEILATIHQKVRGVPAEEMEADLDEAMKFRSKRGY